jgi:hypothetical protein
MMLFMILEKITVLKIHGKYWWSYIQQQLSVAPFLNIVHCSGLLDHFWPPVVQCYATEDAVRIVYWFYLQSHTRNYIHLQLSIILLHIYTAYDLTRS